ncbi:MAG: methionine gamma-lyase family protein [Clostridia bacterium]|nr:methionine gamma-lyase family protein [Clostridia bacterium]
MIDIELINKCEKELQPNFEKLEEISLFNQEKVLNAFQNNRLALRHFTQTTGYGYGDEGRDTLNAVFADVFKAEMAIVSPSIVSGTHALSLALFGILRPNDSFVSITGEPYDTLNDVIRGENNGSLRDFSVYFDVINLKDDKIDKDVVKEYLTLNKPKMVYLQRSRGYDWRNAFTISEIEDIVKFVREVGFDGCIMLDNCYGEFVEKKEPIEVGINVIAGSMIKNIGGGIAPTGGYVVGDKKYLDLINARLTAPSIAGEVGSYANTYQYFYQGLFLAPHVVKEALKGSLLFGKVLSELGYETSPNLEVLPGDIIRAIKFNTKEELIAFIQSIQKNSPIDSYVLPEAWDMPGYEDQVIMAAGCFVQGASIELSADAPIRPPYIGYMQGGLTYEHCKIALKNMKF